MNNSNNRKETKFGKWYRKWIAKWIPEYAVLSLISCFVLNSLIYSGTQFALKNVAHKDLTSDLDRAVPFVPQWILIYLGCFLFWAINYILITREGKEKWFRFAAADMMSRLICGAFFIALPTQNIRPEVTGTDFCSMLVRFVYWIDMPVNLFPSIHCLVSWFCFVGLRGSKKIPKWYQGFSMIFALLVCASTQFTKQHYLIDIAAGLLIAEVCYFITTHTNLYKGLQKVFEKLQYVVFGKES